MENQKTLLSADILHTLKCSICDNFLTVPPITITSIYGNEWKCGRCASVMTELNIPAIMFELIAVNLKFPCIYTNCDEDLAWGDVKDHEKSCPYQPMKCPCGETVEMHSCHMHFRQHHPEIISKDSTIMENPEYSQFHTRLILNNDIPFLVYILCDRKADIKVS
ncbi:hypothetical protein NQ314_008973 [Rhamnusium bicolor]|uniref:RING-type E3 ubiquitin transferase n=1 Tax=Rhamnusium bicolor TaxID=1586634 RepID=A0AAV8Y5J1_9CUCU|nr:hypothetical protein NQ314_008973 [Rhamnusium bicolor]